MPRIKISLAAISMVALSVTALVALFAIVGDIFPDGGEGGSVPPIGEAVALEVSVDPAFFADPPDAAAQRAMLVSVLPALNARMPDAAITQIESPEAPGTPRLLVEAPVSAGLRRRSVIARTVTSGALTIAPVATADDLEGVGATLGKERERFEVWDSREKGPPVGAFAAVRREDGGPHPNVRWLQPPPGDTGAPPRPVAVFVDPDPKMTFGVADLSRVYSANTELGFVIREDRREDFRAFTTRYESRRVAFAVGDRILMAPIMNFPLSVGGFIMTGDGSACVEDLVLVLRHPIEDVPLRADIVPLQGR